MSAPTLRRSRWGGVRPRMARWQSGDAADCKSVYVGSIPARASILSEIFRQPRLKKRPPRIAAARLPRADSHWNIKDKARRSAFHFFAHKGLAGVGWSAI